MSDYRITIKVQNNNILGRILEAGYNSVGEFCRLNKVLNSSGSALGEIINMKKTPLTAKGDFKSCIKNSAFILQCSPEDFFTENQLNCAMESNKRILEIEEAEMQFMMENKLEPKLLEEQVMDDRLPKDISKLLDTLTPREAKVIAMRFGVDGSQGEHTLAEVAQAFGVTRELIRQIEVKALRKLRHPSRAKGVREYLESE